MDLIDLGDVELTAADAVGASTGFFAGVVELNGRVIRILNPTRLFTSGEVAQLDMVGQ